MIINLTGQSGSGKTAIAKELLKLIPKSINIDEAEDDFDLDLAYLYAINLVSKGYTPIISFISPIREKREELKRKAEVFEVYLFTSEIRGKGIDQDYQPPSAYFLPLDTTNQNADKIADEIYTIIKTRHFKNLIVQTKNNKI